MTPLTLHGSGWRGCVVLLALLLVGAAVESWPRHEVNENAAHCCHMVACTPQVDGLCSLEAAVGHVGGAS